MAPGRDASAADWKEIVAAVAEAVGLAVGVGLVWAFLPRDIVLLAALAVAGAGAWLAGLALRRSRNLRRSSEKMSSEIDAISRRLVRLDADLSDLGRREFPEPQSTFEEVTAEIGLLGGLVRDIAVTMASHEKDLAGLKIGQSTPVAIAPAPELGLDDAPARTTREEPPIRFDPAPAKQRPMLRPEFREISGPPRGTPAPAEAPSSPISEPIPIRLAPPLTPEPEPASNAARDAAVLQAFDHARGVELFLQAIVALPQRKLKLYEAQPRLRLSEDSLADAADFVPVLERHGRLADLDRLVLARSAIIARHLAARGSEAVVALSLSPASVAMPGFLRAVGQFVEGHAELSGRLILGLSQRCWRTLDAERIAALTAMRGRGLGFMLDRTENLEFDAAALAGRGVRYVKVSAEALLNGPAANGGAEPAGVGIAALLSQEGISLVADRVEREGEVPDLIELGAALAQGSVFAPPRAVRADALVPPPGAVTETQPVTEPPSAPEPTAEAPTVAAERKPFRAFLRRAG